MTDSKFIGLAHSDSSQRLRAAMNLGTHPDSTHIEELLARCRVEPDFYVREMLTWALIQHDHGEVLSRLANELRHDSVTARSQALHTLTKIGDESTGEWIHKHHLIDADDDVARTAWRAAAELMPPEWQSWLLSVLVTQLGRGDFELKRSLARAFVTIGEVSEPVLEREEILADDAAVREHAAATLRLLEDPESTFFLNRHG